MARLKAANSPARKDGAVVLAADTIVVLEQNILGKPRDKKEALTKLNALSGRTHAVITACCILDTRDRVQESFSLQTAVTMADHDPEILSAYIDSGEPLDKAGSYAIQGAGCFLISSIQGSFSNVIGLPMPEVVAALMKLKAVAAAPQDIEHLGQGPG